MARGYLVYFQKSDGIAETTKAKVRGENSQRLEGCQVVQGFAERSTNFTLNGMTSLKSFKYINEMYSIFI